MTQLSDVSTIANRSAQRLIARAREIALSITVAEIQVYPRMAFFELKIRPEGRTTMANIMSKAQDIAMAARSLSVNRPPRVYAGDTGVVVEVAYGLPQSPSLGSIVGRARGYHMIIGVNAWGKTTTIDVTQPSTPHVLIAGTTGSGKTALLHTMMLSLNANSPAPARMIWVDPKRIARPWLKEIRPYLVGGQITDPSEATRALSGLCSEMDAGNVYQTPVLIFIDELADLFEVGGEDARVALRRIAARGREHGLHVIAATQKPTVKILDSAFVSNIPARVVLRVINATDSYTASGREGIGAELLPPGGHGYYVDGFGVTRILAAMPNYYGSVSPYGEDVTSDAAPLVGIESLMQRKLISQDSPKEIAAPNANTSRRPEDYTLAERVKLIRAWNPSVSKTAVQKVLAPSGTGGGFYAISEVWGDENV